MVCSYTWHTARCQRNPLELTTICPCARCRIEELKVSHYLHWEPTLPSAWRDAKQWGTNGRTMVGKRQSIEWLPVACQSTSSHRRRRQHQREAPANKHDKYLFNIAVAVPPLQQTRRWKYFLLNCCIFSLSERSQEFYKKVYLRHLQTGSTTINLWSSAGPQHCAVRSHRVIDRVLEFC